MAVLTTYPGVYIEEIPSGVHTITGVATSIAAFIGYTEQGPVNQAVHIFSFADYQRAFGGLTVDSPLSYAVNLFFQNGGTEAYVVRIASGATSASITLNDADGTPAIAVTAASDGTWGNLVQLDVDYNTTSPDSLFNLVVTQYVNQNGQLVLGLIETYRNLSMNWMNPNYFLPAINGASQLIEVALDIAPAGFNNKGFSQGGAVTVSTLPATKNRVAVSVDGGTPQEFAFFNADLNQANPTALVAQVAPLLQAGLNGAFGPSATKVTISGAGTSLIVTSQTPGQKSSVRFLNASQNDACSSLHLGLANGGFEVEGAAKYRPVASGNLGTALASPLPALPANAKIKFDLFQVGSQSSINGTTISLPVTFQPAPTGPGDVAAALAAAFAAQTNPAPQYLPRTTRAEVVWLAGAAHLRLVPGLPGGVYFKITDSGDGAANALGLTTTLPPPPLSANVAHYTLGSGSGDSYIPTISNAVPGANGSLPGAPSDFGSQADKTGLYSLDNVDIFNIMCLPDVADNPSLTPLYPDVIAYCQLRRAMLILDLPVGAVTIAAAQSWLSGTATTILGSGSYAAAYFPRIQVADPLQNGNIRPMPNSGAIAGIWARTDGQRGVWKAGAGTEAQINGASGLTYRMNDQENGQLNPLGLNCLRTFPVIGTVVWGARTLRGADALDDDYKYIPVRRLALFLEESLFRGTQWVVFEPNDEPLWAQIRLTVGSFMQSLYRQGAFAGQTPRDAYFVKCDSESTTPLDQDQGRVNIIVGFAPLRPAEFVIIQIQQIVSVGPT
jgi:phage tail sheath protein FI